MVSGSIGILSWREELGALQARLGELFVRAEPRRQARLYLEGLLSATKRKNGWQLAEQIGDARSWRTQHVFSHILWDQEAARDLCRDDVLEWPAPIEWSAHNFSGVWRRAALTRSDTGRGAA